MTAPKINPAGPLVTVAAGSPNIVLDCRKSLSFTIYLQATMGTVTVQNPVAGAVYTFYYIQDPTGGHAYTWPSPITWTDSAPTNTAANFVQIVSLAWSGAQWFEVSRSGQALSIANGTGLTSAAGAKFITGPAGGTWQTYPKDASTVSLVVNGLSGTADLQEWKNDGVNSVAKITSTGGLTVTTAGAGSSTDALVLGESGTGNSKSLRVSGGTLQLLNTAFSTVIFSVSDTGAVTTDGGLTVNGSRVVANKGLAILGTDNVTTGAALYVAPALAGSQPTTIFQQASGQTSDLTQWQDFAGNPVTHITSAGRLGIGFAPPAAMVSAVADASTTVGVIVQGHGGQSASLTQWQNSVGSVLASISAVGGIVASTAHFTAVGGTDIPLIAKGVAVQTGDLTQWQDAPGSVLSKVYSDGAFLMPGASVIADSASRLPLLVKGFTGQTASLTEWQDVNGNALASVIGSTITSSTNSATPNAQMGTTSGAGFLWLRKGVTTNPGASAGRYLYVDTNDDLTAITNGGVANLVGSCNSGTDQVRFDGTNYYTTAPCDTAGGAGFPVVTIIDGFGNEVNLIVEKWTGTTVYLATAGRLARDFGTGTYATGTTTQVRVVKPA